MNRSIILFFVCLLLTIQAKAQQALPQVVSGKIERIEHFPSRYVTSRTIDIWLPEDYSSATKYAVLYMHDGQMLYDANTTWNHQSWDVDDVASTLFASDAVRKFIVVGIWNGGQTRHQDYFPQLPFEQLTQSEKDTVISQLKKVGRIQEGFAPQSDNYLRFIVKELKPYIDQHYSVKTNRANTFIAGSSMGGLISLYAICEYPQIFAGAACLSTHWTGTFTLEHNPMPNSFITYLSKKLPHPNTHKIYFDCGDKTLDSLYPNIQKRVDSLMIRKGYHQNNWMTKYFEGDDHSEKSWHRRLNIPLAFLMRK